MSVPHPHALLHAPYHAPRLRVGDVTTCLLRDCDVVITSWTDARISWPRCRGLERKGGSGLLLAGDLLRAVECESELAIMHWWGVTKGVVTHWRKVLGIGRLDTEGSQRLHQQKSQAGAEVIKAREFTEAERDAHREINKRLNLAQHMQPGYHGPWWSVRELALLGTMPDRELADLLNRSANAVRLMRERRGIPSHR